jgi:hypothetical protein
MSVSYHSYLVAGVKSEKIVRKEEIRNKVTKYDPDTGKPYDKTVIEIKHFFGDLEVSDVSLEEMLDEAKKVSKLSKLIEYYYADCEDNDYVIGLLVSRAGDPGIVPVSQEAINKAVENCKRT